MVECLYIAGILAVIVPTTVCLLAWRDRRRWQKHERTLPVDERIEEVKEAISGEIEELPKARRNLMAAYPNREEAWSWVDPVTEFYRGLEALASSKDTTAQEAMDLAQEAETFLRQKKVKGVFVADLAERLAKLIQERDSVA